MLNTVRAVLVGAEAKPYGEFTDRQTGEVKAPGVTYRLHVSLGFEQAPVELKCTEADYRQGLGLGAGAKLDVLYEIGARNNRVTYTCRGLTPVSANGAAVKA